MSNNTNSKENKNIKALFTVVCLCIISLGLIVYFSGTRAPKNNAVNENQTLKITTTQQTTEVQHAATVTETQTQTTEKATKKAEKKTTEKQTMPKSKSNTPYKSFYKYPLSEAVLKGYSEELVFDDTMGDWRAHAAVDFKGGEGDEVVAINDGLVLDVYTDNLLGNVVEVDHGGKLIARYCGLEAISVKKGEFIDIGNQIGTLGKVPCEADSEAHLHFETKIGKDYVNPLDVMGKTE